MYYAPSLFDEQQDMLVPVVAAPPNFEDFQSDRKLNSVPFNQVPNLAFNDPPQMLYKPLMSHAEVD